MAQRLIFFGVFGVLAVFSSAAENLPDPTRPPAMNDPVAGGVSGVALGAPVLQSIMWSPGRRHAVISGQLLSEGEKFGELKLLKIGENAVELDGPEGRQTLRLFPGVEKTPSAAPATVKVSKP